MALLFRDLGTDNVFAFHLTGDPYVTPNEKEARRKPLKLSFVRDIARLGTAIRDVGAQVIVPTVSNGQVSSRGPAATSRTRCSSRVPRLRSSTSSAPSSRRGRPFTELEDREGAHVAVVGANLAEALFGSASPLGQTLTLAGDTYIVVGRAGEAPRRILRREPPGQRAEPARRHRARPLRRTRARRALHAREAGPARGLFRAGRGDPAAAAQAAAHGRERLHPLHGGSDHRDV